MTRSPRLITVAMVLALSGLCPAAFAQYADSPAAQTSGTDVDDSPATGTAAQPAPAEESSPISRGSVFSLDYGKLVLQDAGHVLTAPIRWRGDEWRDFGLITLGIVGSSLLDRKIEHATQNSQSSAQDSAARIFGRFGAEYSAAVLGGFYLGGLVTGDLTAKAVVQDGIVVTLLGTGIISPALNFVVGRSRPSKNKGTHDFHPFGGDASFPSGHTTQAFAVASVIAAHYDQWWVKTMAYSVAGLTGYARVYQNRHFFSDVVASGALGTLIGHAVVRFNNEQRHGSRLALVPLIDGEARGVALTYDFR